MSWSHPEEQRERGVGRAVGAGRCERAAVRERERVDEHALLERVVLPLREELGLGPVRSASAAAAAAAPPCRCPPPTRAPGGATRSRRTAARCATCAARRRRHRRRRPAGGWWHTRIMYCTHDSSMISDDSITALILYAEAMVELAHSAAPGGRSPGLQGEALTV